MNKRDMSYIVAAAVTNTPGMDVYLNRVLAIVALYSSRKHDGSDAVCDVDEIAEIAKIRRASAVTLRAQLEREGWITRVEDSDGRYGRGHGIVYQVHTEKLAHVPGLIVPGKQSSDTHDQPHRKGTSGVPFTPKKGTSGDDKGYARRTERVRQTHVKGTPNVPLNGHKPGIQATLRAPKEKDKGEFEAGDASNSPLSLKAINEKEIADPTANPLTNVPAKGALRTLALDAPRASAPVDAGYVEEEPPFGCIYPPRPPSQHVRDLIQRTKVNLERRLAGDWTEELDDGDAEESTDPINDTAPTDKPRPLYALPAPAPRSNDQPPSNLSADAYEAAQAAQAAILARKQAGQ